MEQAEIKQILERVGAVLTDDHFLLKSGKHSSAYVNKDALYPHTWETRLLCNQIALQFVSSRIEVVIAPAIGGVVLTQWVAHALGELTGLRPLAVYGEKEMIERSPVSEGGPKLFEETGNFIIARGYDQLIGGKRTLVVEDVLTTGGSVKHVVDAARVAEADIVAVAALCNRGNVTPNQIGVNHLFNLLRVELETWEPDVCPLCREGKAINTQVGHGKNLVA